MAPARKRKKLAQPAPAAISDVQNGGSAGSDDSAEAEDIVSDEEEAQAQFPADKLRQMFAFMLSDAEDRRPFIARFSEHIEHDDVQRGGLGALAIALAETKAAPTQLLSCNLFHVLKLFKVRGGKRKAQVGVAADAKALEHFDALWLRLLQLPLPPSLYRRVLALLPERVLPHLRNPLRLTDFLLTSYQVGGVVSILALQGVFYLMQHHNLEYPDFYTKLYSLLEPNALRGPQRARFFRLVDLFLGSGYLPEYLVAAFVKRLSRLALTAPTPTQTMLIRLICSLMVRHRGLQRMTDDPRGATRLPADPYRPDEPEPARCGAAESALWEVRSLRSHLVPAVSRAASFAERELPELEHPLAELLETTYDDMLEAEFGRQVKEVALTFHRPEGVLSWREDRLSTDWKL
ncbi:nucleolar complex protein 4 homolog isoform X2 [Pollicipes pollicipes]|nr:nucleolar complex protein 4 homolog isoform X2 [Pollicipes pollicipes]XP_037068038.1 nucleolar complex protein 4 homolog isoform X2 [Pollicipes pollicipes]